MKILALELSSARGSIAAQTDDDPSTDLRTSLDCDWANDRKHSGMFFANLEKINKKLDAPGLVVVGLGPGSYAGVRIAISAAIGLKTASGARLVGLPSICALECDEKEYAVIGDARRNSFFFARIRNNDLVEGPILLGEAEVGEKLDRLEKMSIFCSEPLPQFARVMLRYPSAKLLARLAQDANRNFTLPPLEPIYLREPHITTPRAATRP